MAISEKLERFKYFNFEKNFLENEILFQKTGVPLVESTKIENASFPYKTTISEANVKTNRMVSAKWTYNKERSLPVTTLIFLRFCVSLRTSYKGLN